MVGCSILGCTSRSERKIKGITFHRFPSDDCVKEKWISFTFRPNWRPSKYSKICSIHFEKENFFLRGESVFLHPNSEPTIYTPVTTSRVAVESNPSRKRKVKFSSAEGASQSGQDGSSQSGQDCALQSGQDGASQSGQDGASQSGQDGASQSDSVISTPKERELEKLLLKEKSRSAAYLKKLRAVRESKRRLLKKSERLRDIITELKFQMLKSEDIDILSHIEMENIDFFEVVY